MAIDKEDIVGALGIIKDALEDMNDRLEALERKADNDAYYFGKADKLSNEIDNLQIFIDNLEYEEEHALKQGDKIRRKGDGKLFTYTGRDDSDDEDYGHVEEMAVPVYLPDFEKEEN